MPAAFTRMRTSPSLGSGSGSSRTSSTWGGPIREIHTRLTEPSLLRGRLGPGLGIPGGRRLAGGLHRLDDVRVGLVLPEVALGGGGLQLPVGGAEAEEGLAGLQV